MEMLQKQEFSNFSKNISEQAIMKDFMISKMLEKAIPFI